MSSIQTALLSRPLPLSESNGSSPIKLPTMPQAAGKLQGMPQVQNADKVAKDFESVFTSMMMKEMRKSIESGSFFDNDKSDVYGGMFDQFLGQHMSDNGGIGMAKMIREALNRITPGDMPSSVTLNTEA